MKVIYLDCFSGISGNMLLGAFIDAGVPEEKLRAVIAKLHIDGYHLSIERVVKTGLSAIHLDVHLEHHHDHAHDNSHGHHHHKHRHLPDIIEIIDCSSLNETVKEASKKVFLRLAQAEAKVHGTTIDQVHFHEVGAVDTIIDIVGTVWCLNYLEIEAIYTSKINTGFGFVQCSHGIMPIPAPATAELLTGIPHYAGNIERELVTPTGAAIIAALGTGYGKMPSGFISHKIAYGAGTWNLEIPNVVRLHIGEITEATENDEILVLEANIDDLSPQIYEYAMDKLFEIGALDVWLTPIIMKKSRPATLVSVLVTGQDLDKATDILFSETSTIGVRYYPVKRKIAQRGFATVHSPWGNAKVKISTYNGKICHVSPEYEDCRHLAKENNVPLKKIQQTVLEASINKLK
ncbi:Pyridinium-3,5-bisthiocarboxylic acid mononucleotide nickel insertion protein [bioreactor metagenome]|uniref:Pyridinium-3,5-bisthiocarboxylic acid mononucleotide nickel insertion protein n=1 Tax=bioreactor metagenome TaxID=1076179 RepID=A0A644T0Q7_9ZZZZ|nr:nickel pincer cofactor biosynthesis protein LarC [Negativicutes bacterium]